MAVKIRLKKMGSKKRPFYRVVVADSRNPRDGRFVETLGYYDPMSDPPRIELDDDRVYKWLDNGATPTENAAQILKHAGLLERWQLLKRGVQISDLEAKIEEIRAKQPKPQPQTEKRKRLKKKSDEEEIPAEEEKPEAGEVDGESEDTVKPETEVQEGEPETGEKPENDEKTEKEEKKK